MLQLIVLMKLLMIIGMIQKFIQNIGLDQRAQVIVMCMLAVCLEGSVLLK